MPIPQSAIDAGRGDLSHAPAVYANRVTERFYDLRADVARLLTEMSQLVYELNAQNCDLRAKLESQASAEPEDLFQGVIN